MAEQKGKSQAQKAASASKTKTAAGGRSVPQKKTAKAAPQEESPFSPRFIGAGICLVLFIVLLVIFLEPEGALTKLFASFLMGIIGRMGFLISIPASLYLFFIFAFSGKRPVRMRTICIIAFVLLCGCISHLILMPENGSFGFQTIGELYSTGGSGASGGLLCGLLAIFLQWLCGRVLSFVILIVGGVLTLLGGMQITVPSIVRAVRNRPRAAWELSLIHI